MNVVNIGFENISEITMLDFAAPYPSPYYIVAHVDPNGRLYALGIETARQVWRRCESHFEQVPNLNPDLTPIMISPVVLPNVNVDWTESHMDWNIPLIRRR